MARLAGVSTAVVSYVINDGPRAVAPETRRRVEEAILQLRYRPDRLAQALGRHHRTGLVGVIAPDMRRTFLAEAVYALEQAASRRGLTLIAGNSGLRSEREPYYRNVFLGMRVAGLVVVGAAPLPATVELAESEDTPVVQLYGPAPAEPIATQVTCDENESGRLATAHLLDHGHREVCLFAEPDNPVAAQRAEGWRAAVTDAGAHGRLFAVPGDRHGAFEVARALLGGRTGQRRPVAVVCGTDEQALGVIGAARSLGVPVPAGLAVVGQDGIREAAFHMPALTTVTTDLHRSVRAALDALRGATTNVDRSATSHEAPSSPHEPPGRPRLQPGGSCGCEP